MLVSHWLYGAYQVDSAHSKPMDSPRIAHLPAHLPICPLKKFHPYSVWYVFEPPSPLESSSYNLYMNAGVEKRGLAIFWYKNQPYKPTNEKVAVEFILH